MLPEPPSPGAPEVVRRSALADLAPVGQLDVVSVRSGTAVAQTTAFLMLGNGMRVEDPRDFLVVVPKASATAQYAEEFGVRFNGGNRALLVEFISFAAGLTLGTVGMAMGLTGSAFDSSGRYVGPTAGPGVPVAAAGLVGFAVGLVAMFFGMADWGAATKARASAFLAYPRDLQRQLGFLDAPAVAPTP